MTVITMGTKIITKPQLYLQLFLLLHLLFSRTDAVSQEIDVVNRPVNISGLTGLIVTTSPYTMPKGVLETAGSAMSETSAIPDYTLSEFPISLTVGITPSMEIAVRGSYVTLEEGSIPADTTKKRGTGDAELLYKWNFIPPGEKQFYPAAAVFMAVQGLTGNREYGFQRMHNWGARIGISIGREIAWEEHIAGIYIDGQIVVRDLNETQYRDRFGVFNAGMLLPISKRQNLQLLLEYSAINGKMQEDIDGMDSSTITYGIRLVSEWFNLTVGDQFIHKELAGYHNSGRVVGTLSVKY